MTRTTGLVRVTVAAPRRRIDLTLPEQSPIAEILPVLLRHAGDGLADEAARTGGWLLRRADGTPIDDARTLGSHRVRDGEVLHLVPRAVDWPELAYDDVVDAIATGAGRTGRWWSPRHTRLTGLVLGATAVLLVLVTLLRAGPPAAILWSFGLAVLLLVAGTVSSRALGDSGLGSLLGALALPFAIAGGALLPSLGTAQLLAASASLLVASVIGFLGVADRLALFAGGTATGLLGITGSWLADFVAAHQAAAIVAGGLLVLSPVFGPLSIRLGRVPMPALPRTTADLVRDDPQPPRPAVYQAVVRADALLTGLLCGTAAAAILGQILLIHSGRTAALWYAGLLVVGFLLRARLYPAVRHRLPLLSVGVAGAVGFAVMPLSSLDLPIIVAVLSCGGAVAIAAGVFASIRPLNPYLGRYAELLETATVLAVVPVCCAVLGLYSFLRGIGG